MDFLTSFAFAAVVAPVGGRRRDLRRRRVLRVWIPRSIRRLFSPVEMTQSLPITVIERKTNTDATRRPIAIGLARIQVLACILLEVGHDPSLAVVAVPLSDEFVSGWSGDGLRCDKGRRDRWGRDRDRRDRGRRDSGCLDARCLAKRALALQCVLSAVSFGGLERAKAFQKAFPKVLIGPYKAPCKSL